MMGWTENAPCPIIEMSLTPGGRPTGNPREASPYLVVPRGIPGVEGLALAAMARQAERLGEAWGARRAKSLWPILPRLPGRVFRRVVRRLLAKGLVQKDETGAFRPSPKGLEIIREAHEKGNGLYVLKAFYEATGNAREAIALTMIARALSLGPGPRPWAEWGRLCRMKTLQKTAYRLRDKGLLSIASHGRAGVALSLREDLWRAVPEGWRVWRKPKPSWPSPEALPDPRKAREAVLDIYGGDPASLTHETLQREIGRLLRIPEFEDAPPPPPIPRRPDWTGSLLGFPEEVRRGMLHELGRGQDAYFYQQAVRRCPTPYVKVPVGLAKEVGTSAAALLWAIATASFPVRSFRDVVRRLRLPSSTFYKARKRLLERGLLWQGPDRVLAPTDEGRRKLVGPFWKIRRGLERYAGVEGGALLTFIVEHPLNTLHRFGSVRWIAERMGMGRRAIRRALARLGMAGILFALPFPREGTRLVGASALYDIIGALIRKGATWLARRKAWEGLARGGGEKIRNHPPSKGPRPGDGISFLYHDEGPAREEASPEADGPHAPVPLIWEEKTLKMATGDRIHPPSGEDMRNDRFNIFQGEVHLKKEKKGEQALGETGNGEGHGPGKVKDRWNHPVPVLEVLDDLGLLVQGG